MLNLYLKLIVIEGDPLDIAAFTFWPVIAAMQK
jgi:hypothetical protein